MARAIEQIKAEHQFKLSPQEKARLHQFADLIGNSILVIRAQDFSEDSARKLHKIANIIRRIYRQDRVIVRIMSEISDAITGHITVGDIRKLEDLNLEFRNYIRKN